MDTDLDQDTGRDMNTNISNNIDIYTIESVLDIFWSFAKKKKDLENIHRHSPTYDGFTLMIFFFLLYDGVKMISIQYKLYFECRSFLKLTMCGAILP